VNYAEDLAADARLCILKELALQTNGRLNELALMRTLDTFGITRSRDWVRTQLRKMDELGAVNITEAGTVMVAALTKLGRAHIERREIVEGIARPSDED
jgi:hypothetical protein